MKSMLNFCVIKTRRKDSPMKLILPNLLVSLMTICVMFQTDSQAQTILTTETDLHQVNQISQKVLSSEERNANSIDPQSFVLFSSAAPEDITPITTRMPKTSNDLQLQQALENGQDSEHHGRMLTNSCSYCQYQQIYPVKSTDPVYQVYENTGDQSIDVISWFGTSSNYNCYVTFKFYDENYNEFDTRLFREDSTYDGIIYARTNNWVSGEDPTEVVLIAKATNYCNTVYCGVQKFTVRFRTNCDDVDLDRPEIQMTNISQTLFTTQQFFFEPAYADPASCVDSITYEVLFFQTHTPIPACTVPASQDFSQTLVYFECLPTERNPYVIQSPIKIKIRATFAIESSSQVEFSYPMFWTVTEPCLDTVIQDLIIADQEYILGDPQSTIISFPFFTDSVSQQFSTQFGNGSQYDICAPQSYQLFEQIGTNQVPVPFATLSNTQNGGQITIQTNQQAEVGNYQLILKVTLDNYQIFLEVPIFLEILPCEITTLQVSTPPQTIFEYTLEDSTLFIDLPSATLQPTFCNQDVIYTILDPQTNQSPTFATICNQGTQICIQTSSTGDLGPKQILLEVKPSGASQVAPVLITYDIEIDRCGSATISGNFSLTQLSYLTSDGPMILDPTFQTNPPNCSVTFILEQTGSFPYDPSILVLDSQFGSLTLNTNNKAYDGLTIDVTLTATSTKSGFQLPLSLQIVIEDACKNLVQGTIPPILQSNMPLEFPLWQETTIFFTQAVTGVENESWYNCGTFTYVLKHVSNGLQVDPTVFSVQVQGNQLVVTGLPAEIDPWITNGPFELQIEATLSSGQQVYLTINSDPFIIEMTNPCESTTLTPQSIPNFTIAIADPPLPVFVSQTQDSISVLYGGQFGDSSGFDLCGPRIYELFVQINGFMQVPQFGSLTNPPIEPNFTLQTSDQNLVGSYQTMIQVSLQNYPNIVPVHQQFTVQIVECSISALSATQPTQVSFDYDILQPTATLLTIPVPQYTVTPSNCPNGDKDGLIFDIAQNPLNPTLNFDNNFDFINLQSGNPNDFGSLEFTLTIRPAENSSQAQPVNIQFTIQLSRCQIEQEIFDGQILDLQYTIGSGPISIDPLLNPLFYPECPLSFNLQQQGSQPYNQNILTLSTQSGILIINTSNPVDNGLTIFVTLQASATANGQSDVQLFQIQISNGCNAITALPPTISGQILPLEFTVYELTQFIIDPPQTSPPFSTLNCGTFSYELRDTQTGFILDPNTFFITEQNEQILLNGQPSSLNPITPFEFIIEATLGTTQEQYLTTQSAPIQAQLSNPCESTTLQPATIPTQTFAIAQAPLQVSIQQTQDSVSQQYGSSYGNGSGFDLCGPRTYQFFIEVNGSLQPVPFGSLTNPQNDPSITLQTNDPNQVGAYSAVLIVQLQDYTNVPQISQAFTIEIIDCLITSLTYISPSITEYNYEINTPANILNIPVPQYSLNPTNCPGGDKNGLIFSIQQSQNTPLASFANNFTQVQIQTNNPNDFGTFVFDLTIQPNTVNSPAQPIIVTYTVNLTRCQVDLIVKTGIVSNFEYELGSGLLLIDSLLEATYPECQPIFSFVQIGNQPYNQGILSQNQNTGELLLDTASATDDGLTISVTLTAESQSGDLNTQQFDILVSNGCSQLTLQAPNLIDQEPLQFAVWQIDQYAFSLANSNPLPSTYCGSFTYQLQFATTGTPVDQNVFSLTETNGQLILQGQPDTFTPWFTNSPFQFQIVTTLGSQQEIYQTVTSTPFQIQVDNPCEITQILGQTIPQQTISVGDQPLQVILPQFTDQISVQASQQFGDGSGFDLCGPRIYELFEQNGQNLDIPGFGALISPPNDPSVSLQAPTQNLAGTKIAILRVTLQDYPIVIPLLQDFAVNIIGCSITNLAIQTPTQTIYNYDINSPANILNIPVPQYSVTPANCPGGDKDGLQFTVQQNPANPQVTFDQNFTLLQFFTDNPADFGQLNFDLVIQPASQSSQIQPQVISYTVNLDRCQLNQVIQTGLIGSVVYTLGTGPLEIFSKLESLYSECPLTFQLAQSGSFAYNTNILTQNGNSGNLVINTSTVSYTGLIISVQLTATSINGQTAEQLFEIEIENGCSSLNGQAPTIQDVEPLQFEQWSLDTYLFTQASTVPAFNPINCGQFTYQLVFASNNLQVDPQVFSLSESNGSLVLSGQPIAFNPWVQTQFFDFQIVASLTDGTSTFLTLTSNPFTIQVSDPCLSTQILAQNIADQTIAVADPPLFVPVAQFQDSVSVQASQFGNGSGFDLCGPRNYEFIQNLPPQSQGSLGSLQNPPNSPDLTLQVTDPNLVNGPISVQIRVSLQNYPQVPSFDQSFTITVNQCQITQLQVTNPAQTQYPYAIQTPPNLLSIPVPQYTVQPTNCPGGDKDGLVFSLTQNPPTAPQVQFGSNFSELTLQTSDPNDFGTLTIDLTIASASAQSQVQPYTEQYTVALSRCGLDLTQSQGAIQNLSYVVASGPLSVPSQLTNTYPECAVEFELFVNSLPDPISPDPFSISNPQTGLIEINSSNLALLGSSNSVQVLIRSLVSQDTATNTFQVIFVSGCSPLPPTFNSNGPILANLYQQNQVIFNRAAGNPTGCASFTYSLQAINLPQQLVDDNFFVENPQIVSNPAFIGFTLPDKNSFPPGFQIQLKVVADSGPFGVTESQILTISVTDPCVNTVIQGQTINDMVYVLNDPISTIQEFATFQDSISQQFGNASGFDLCGPQTYAIFKDINGNLTPSNLVTTQVLSQTTSQLSLQTSDQNNLGLNEMALCVTLTDYNIESCEIFTAIVECEVTIQSLSAPQTQFSYDIQNPASNLQIPVPIVNYTPPLCQVPFEFEAQLIDSQTQQALNLPLYVTLDQTNGLLVTTDDPQDFGSIEIIVKASPLGQPFTNQPSIVYTINLDRCSLDVVSQSNQIGPINYVIGSGAFNLLTGITNLFSECPITFQFTTNGQNSDPAIFTLNPTTGVITINSSDQNLIGQSLSGQIVGISSTQGSQFSESFQIGFVDTCKLQQAVWLQTPIQFDFRAQPKSIQFSPSSFQNTPQCDLSEPISYTLFDDLNNAVAQNLYVPVSVQTGALIGSVEIIQNVQGTYFFKLQASISTDTVLSLDVEVQITDLCPGTQLIADPINDPLILTALGEDQDYPVPSAISTLEDSLSQPQICGQIIYTLILPSINSPGGLLPSTVNIKLDTDDLNNIKIEAESTSASDFGQFELIVRAQLLDYQQVLLDRPTTLSINECFVEEFQFAQQIGDIVYEVGSTPQTRLLMPFIMSPSCGYPIDYSFQQVNINNVLSSLPDFIDTLVTSNPQTGELIYTLAVETQDLANIGETIVEVTGQIASGPQAGILQDSFRFVVTVAPANTFFASSGNTPPIFDPEPEPIIITKQGSENFDFTLEIPPTFDAQNDNIQINFDFGPLQGFVEYDQSNSQVIPNQSSNLDLVPAIRTQITIILSDDNPTGSLSSIYTVAFNIMEDESNQEPEEPELIDAAPALISEITNTGEISVVFDEEEALQGFLDLIEQQNAEGPNARLLRSTQKLAKKRTLQDISSPQADNGQLIKVQLIPAPEQDAQNLDFNWQVIGIEGNELKLQLDFTNAEQVSSLIDNDQVEITVADPRSVTDPTSKDIRAPTVVRQDIVRQIDNGIEQVQFLEKLNNWITIVYLFVALANFFYFIWITSGREDPYLWSFLNTMQLLTHIQLVNVKIPGNIALFLNMNNQYFRYNFFPNEWIPEKFGLSLSPSPIQVFIQTKYLQTHMLMHMQFIYLVSIFVVLLMIFTAALKIVGAKSLALQLEKRLYWGLPIRLYFEFFFIIAVSSWHNMLKQGDEVSTYLSYFNLAFLFITLAYVYLMFAKAATVPSKNANKRKEIFVILKSIQKPLRLKRYKPEKMIYPIYYLTRRMILAIVFVYMSEQQMPQLVIFLGLSVGMLFVLVKIRPFADTFMNVVQFVNEGFILVCGIFLIPLCNVLTDLEARNRIGWILFGIVMACILFNLIILLLRSCGLTCEYLKKLRDLAAQTADEIDQNLKPKFTWVEDGEDKTLPVSHFVPEDDDVKPVQKIQEEPKIVVEEEKPKEPSFEEPEPIPQQTLPDPRDHLRRAMIDHRPQPLKMPHFPQTHLQIVQNDHKIPVRPKLPPKEEPKPTVLIKQYVPLPIREDDTKDWDGKAPVIPENPDNLLDPPTDEIPKMAKQENLDQLLTLVEPDSPPPKPVQVETPKVSQQKAPAAENRGETRKSVEKVEPEVKKEEQHSEHHHPDEDDGCPICLAGRVQKPVFDRDVQSSVAFSEVRVDESQAGPNGGFGALLRPLDENSQDDDQSMFGRDDHSFINANRKTMLTQKTFITNMHDNNHISPRSNNQQPNNIGGPSGATNVGNNVQRVATNNHLQDGNSILGDQPNTTFVTNMQQNPNKLGADPNGNQTMGGQGGEHDHSDYPESFFNDAKSQTTRVNQPKFKYDTSTGRLLRHQPSFVEAQNQLNVRNLNAEEVKTAQIQPRNSIWVTDQEREAGQDMVLEERDQTQNSWLLAVDRQQFEGMAPLEAVNDSQNRGSRLNEEYFDGDSRLSAQQISSDGIDLTASMNPDALVRHSGHSSVRQNPFPLAGGALPNYEDSKEQSLVAKTNNAQNQMTIGAGDNQQIQSSNDEQDQLRMMQSLDSVGSNISDPTRDRLRKLKSEFRPVGEHVQNNQHVRDSEAHLDKKKESEEWDL